MTKANVLTLQKVLGLLAVVAVVLGLPGTVLAQPVLPPVFAGTVTVDGVPASNGVTVTAWINNQLAASVAVSNGTYAFAIPQQTGDPFNRGDTITFKIGNIDARETGTWAGDGDELNLTASSVPALPTATPAPTAAPVIIAAATGVPGRQGERGLRGVVGPPGADGKDGQAGRAGQDGARGDNGATGESGRRGDPGPAGKNGEAGVPGEEGAEGRQGRAGPSGTDGKEAGGLFGYITLGVAIVAVVLAGGAILMSRRY